MSGQKQYLLEVVLGASVDPEYYESIRAVQYGMKGIGNAAEDATKRSNAGMKRMQKRVQSFGNKAMEMGDRLAIAGLAGLYGMWDSSMNLFAEYEQELASAGATANASGAELEMMGKAARAAGRDTIKNAQESASALGYMALAGWSVNDSIAGLMPILKESAATSGDLAETSDLVTDSMSAMKLGVKDLPNYLDVVTQANNSANTTSQQLMKAMIRSGGAARSLNVGLVDTATALGILANNGTKAEQAGTAMNAILTRIASNDDAASMMKKLKISIFDTKGEFVGLEQALKNINQGVGGLSTEERARSLKAIAGTEYYSKVLYLLDSVKQGAKGTESAWTELEKKLQSSEGALDRMYEKMTSTAKGAEDELSSAFEEVQLSLADGFDKEYVDVLNTAGDALNVLSENISDFAKEHEVEIHQTIGSMMDMAESAGDVMGKVAVGIYDNMDLISSGMTALKTGKMLKIVEAMCGGFGELDPYMKVLTMGSSALAGIGMYAYQTHQKMLDADLEKHFGNVSLSLEDMDDIAREIVGREDLLDIAGMLDSIGKTDNLLDGMADNLETVNEISWKINAGFSVDKDDKESYKTAAKEYAKAAQDAVSSQGYTVSLATDLLLGNDSGIGKENDAFFAEMSAEIERLEKQLNKRLKNAVKKGLNIDTDEVILETLDNMRDITDAMTMSDSEAMFATLDLKYSGADLTPESFEEMSKEIAEYEKNVVSGAEEAFKASIGTLERQYAAGKISDKEYNKRKKKYQQAYYEKQADALTRGADYMVDSVKDAYPGLGKSMSEVQERLSDAFAKGINGGVSTKNFSGMVEGVVDEVMADVKVDDTTSENITRLFQNGLGDIWNEMETLSEKMQGQGMDVPTDLQSGVTDIRSMSAVTNSADDMMYLLGDAVAKNEKWASIAAAVEQSGASIPEEIAAGMTGAAPEIRNAGNEILQILENSVCGQEISAQITVDVASQALNAVCNYNPTAFNNKMPELNKTTGKKKKLAKNDMGGIWTKPVLTTFAEDGPEMALPLNHSKRAKSLWQHAGVLLGMEPVEDKTSYYLRNAKQRDVTLYREMCMNPPQAVSNRPVQISYAPVIQVNGNADEKVLTKVVKMSQSEFEKMMKQYMHQKGRVSFSK